jgi:hypothetical protein
MEIKGLYIKTATVLLAAMVDSSTFEFKIATVDFSTRLIRFQATFHAFSNANVFRVVFISDTLYYSVSNNL